jgi:hypothetical protein
MRKLLFILALLCSSAWAVVPVRTCTASGAAPGPVTCNITVAAHHLVTTTIFTSQDTNVLSYSDTLGNSYSQNPFTGCYPGSFTPCNAGVAAAQSYSITFASQSSVIFYISTGTFAGVVTFSVSGGVGTDKIYSAEYSQDIIALDAGTQTGTTITTTGANDLIVVMTGDSGVTTCSAITPAAGFTLEFSQNASCKSYSDRINLPPGSYSYKTTLTGNAVPGWTAVAFGVAPFVSSAVRHARNIY